MPQQNHKPVLGVSVATHRTYARAIVRVARAIGLYCFASGNVMWTAESIFELRLDALEGKTYGWGAGFLERPGDSVSNGIGLDGYAECIANAAPDLPDNSLVEIRIDGVSVGTWHVHTVRKHPSRIATEVGARLHALRSEG